MERERERSEGHRREEQTARTADESSEGHNVQLKQGFLPLLLSSSFMGQSAHARPVPEFVSFLHKKKCIYLLEILMHLHFHLVSFFDGGKGSIFFFFFFFFSFFLILLLLLLLGPGHGIVDQH